MIIWEKDIYYIYMDNYYISVELAKNKTHVVETLRKDREGDLKIVIQQKL